MMRSTAQSEPDQSMHVKQCQAAAAAAGGEELMQVISLF